MSNIEGELVLERERDQQGPYVRISEIIWISYSYGVFQWAILFLVSPEYLKIWKCHQAFRDVSPDASKIMHIFSFLFHPNFWKKKFGDSSLYHMYPKYISEISPEPVYGFVINTNDLINNSVIISEMNLQKCPAENLIKHHFAWASSSC